MFALMRACRRAVVGIARFLGFAPISDVQNAIDRIQHQAVLQAEQAVVKLLLTDMREFITQQTAQHAANGTEVQTAVTKLETIADNLTELMQSVWPQAYLDDAFEPSKSTAEIVIS